MTAATFPLRVWDRSRAVKDWQCPRARYYGYEYAGRGLVNPHTSLELFLGTTVHSALAVMASQQLTGHVDIDVIAETARQEVLETLLPAMAGELVSDSQGFANEQAALAEGLIRGFHRAVWPRLMAQYKIVAIEQELEYPHDDTLLFMAKPDLVLEDAEGLLTYLEFKTTSSKKEEWINSWQTAVQLHSTVKAIEHVLGRQVQQVIVQGMYKGWVAYGKQTSPFCYAYLKKGNPPFTRDQISYEWKTGLKKSPSWEQPGGVKQWVANMPEDILAEQYPQTPPIFINHALVDSFFRQRVSREKEIELAMQMLTHMAPEDAAEANILDVAFPQHFDTCSPPWGHSCMFKRICHGNVEDPLSAGYSPRPGHHAREIEMFQEAE